MFIIQQNWSLKEFDTIREATSIGFKSMTFLCDYYERNNEEYHTSPDLLVVCEAQRASRKYPVDCVMNLVLQCSSLSSGLIIFDDLCSRKMSELYMNIRVTMPLL